MSLIGKIPYINHARRHLPGGSDPLPNGPWIYVGDFPGDPLTTPDSPPFENGWENVGSPEAPVSFFKTALGWVHLRGAFAGGTNDTTVFTLPEGYRPAYQQEMVIPTADPAVVASAIVGTDGQVVYLGQVA